MEANPDFLLTRENLLAWEARHGRIASLRNLDQLPPTGAVVIAAPLKSSQSSSSGAAGSETVGGTGFVFAGFFLGFSVIGELYKINRPDALPCEREASQATVEAADDFLYGWRRDREARPCRSSS